MEGGRYASPTLSEALLGSPAPAPDPDPSALLLGAQSTTQQQQQEQQQHLLPSIRVVESGDCCEVPPSSPVGYGASPRAAVRASSLAVSVVLLAKTIMGAGMTALPRATSLLGLILAPSLLALVAWMTHFSIQALTLGTLASGMRIFCRLHNVSRQGGAGVSAYHRCSLQVCCRTQRLCGSCWAGRRL